MLSRCCFVFELSRLHLCGLYVMPVNDSFHVTLSQTIIVILGAISVVLYLTNKGEHTVIYKINKNVYIKTSKIIIV